MREILVVQNLGLLRKKVGIKHTQNNEHRLPPGCANLSTSDCMERPEHRPPVEANYLFALC